MIKVFNKDTTNHKVEMEYKLVVNNSDIFSNSLLEFLPIVNENSYYFFIKFKFLGLNYFEKITSMITRFQKFSSKVKIYSCPSSIFNNDNELIEITNDFPLNDEILSERDFEELKEKGDINPFLTTPA